MQKYITLIAITMALTAFTPLANAETKQVIERKQGDLLIAEQGVNLRKASGTNAPIIRRATANEVVMVEDIQPVDGFISVRMSDGKPAWVSERYVKRIVD